MTYIINSHPLENMEVSSCVINFERSNKVNVYIFLFVEKTNLFRIVKSYYSYYFFASIKTRMIAVHKEKKMAREHYIMCSCT